jgi:hypothetical protein
MVKPQQQKRAKKPKAPKVEDVELVPDAWERFEGAVGKMVPAKRPKAKEAEQQK